MWELGSSLKGRRVQINEDSENTDTEEKGGDEAGNCECLARGLVA